MSADFWAGYVSGAAGIIIGNPLDLIKTRLQAGKNAQHAEAISTSVATPQGFRGNFENAGTLVRGEQQFFQFQSSTKSRNLTTTLQYRRNSPYPNLRRPQRPPLRNIQPHTCSPPSIHLPNSQSIHRNRPIEDLPRRRNRRPRLLHRFRTDRAHKMPRTSLHLLKHDFLDHSTGCVAQRGC
jgi:hypothetical protein